MMSLNGRNLQQYIPLLTAWWLGTDITRGLTSLSAMYTGFGWKTGFHTVMGSSFLPKFVGSIHNNAEVDQFIIELFSRK